MLRTAIIAGSLLAAAGAALALPGSGHGASASVTNSADAARASSSTAAYEAVVNALTQGRDVEITTDLQQCATPNGQPGPDIIGGLHISAFQIVPEQEIAFSDTHQTLDPQNAAITQFIRYTVTPDGATTVATTTLSAGGQVESTVQLDCHIGKGADFHW
jgi:VirK protein